MSWNETLPAINFGEVYVYLPPWPAGCQGHRYLAHRTVLAVPSYQQQILVEAITGPDTGKWFVCSPNNFLSRYEPAPSPEGSP